MSKSATIERVKNIKENQPEDSDDKTKKMVRDFEEGLTVKQIADKYGCPYCAALAALYKNAYRTNDRMKARRELMKAVAAEYETGKYTYREIGEKYNLEAYIIGKLVRDYKYGDQEKLNAIRRLRKYDMARKNETKKRGGRGLTPEEERRKNILDKAYQRCVDAGRLWTEDEINKALGEGDVKK